MSIAMLTEGAVRDELTWRAQEIEDLRKIIAAIIDSNGGCIHIRQISLDAIGKDCMIDFWRDEHNQELILKTIRR